MPSGPQARERVQLTTVGLRITQNISYAEWEQAGNRLTGILDSSMWCLGDWLAYGRQHYSNRYKETISAAGLQYQTLRNYAWVARRFELDRRRPKLTFQHHAEVASMTAEQQDKWLDLAEENLWTTKQLRAHLQGERVGSVRETRQLAVMPLIKVPDSQLSWWHKAAEESGMEFASWALATLDGAAARNLDEDLSDVY